MLRMLIIFCYWIANIAEWDLKICGLFVIRNKTTLQIHIRFIEKGIKNLGLTMNNTVKFEIFKGPIFLLVSTEAKKHMSFSYIIPSNFDIYLYVKWIYNMPMLKNKIKKEFHMCFSKSCLFYNGTMYVKVLLLLRYIYEYQDFLW